MNTSTQHYSWQNNNLLLDVQIQTKASKNAIIGIHNNKLKIAITTAPTDNKANKHLIKYLATFFKVPQNQITIIKGHKTKYKTIKIISPNNKLNEFKK